MTPCAVQLKCQDTYKCILWASKTRVTPLKKLSMPRIEMQGAVIAVRLSEAIRRNAVWTFANVYHIIDSLCTLATLRKDTSALREFMGNRVAEILDTTSVEQWFHVKSENNIADLGTRCNATATDLAEGSEWQDGKPWMSLPITQWPVTQDIGKAEVPEDDIVRAKLCGATQITELPICFEKYLGKSFQFIHNLVARLLWILETKSFKDNEITVENMRKAEKYI